MRAAGLRREFDDAVDQIGRAAGNAQIADPLPAGIEFRVFAIGHGFAGDDDHGHAGDARAVDSHRALQQAGSGMQQHALHASGRQRVAGGDVHGQRLVPAIEQPRTVLALADLLGDRFPDRRPFGAGRRQDVFDAQFPECFENRLSAVEPFTHMMPPCDASLGPRSSAVDFGRSWFLRDRDYQDPRGLDRPPKIARL